MPRLESRTELRSAPKPPITTMVQLKETVPPLLRDYHRKKMYFTVGMYSGMGVLLLCEALGGEDERVEH